MPLLAGRRPVRLDVKTSGLGEIPDIPRAVIESPFCSPHELSLGALDLSDAETNIARPSPNLSRWDRTL
jgi:hypothetical protein